MHIQKWRCKNTLWQKKLSVFVSGPALPEFLLPFRKPKRIRTAFSPSQLLKLEQAFEKNQYVVGAERKELAKSLNLSETQVRRTFKQRAFKVTHYGYGYKNIKMAGL